jgi:hypothetical protein
VALNRNPLTSTPQPSHNLTRDGDADQPSQRGARAGNVPRPRCWDLPVERNAQAGGLRGHSTCTCHTAVHADGSTLPLQDLKAGLESLGRRAASALRRADVLLVATGAGFSADSGLATYDVCATCPSRSLPPTSTLAWCFGSQQGTKRRHPTGREKMGSPTPQHFKEPILLVPWLCFHGGFSNLTRP